MSSPLPTRRLIAAGVVLGIGLGGFLDGIVFHQILQVHSMLSARVPKTTITNLEVNMFWDGLFHAFTWVMTVAGVAMLWRAARQPEGSLSGGVLSGALVAGWGLFNLVEGILNHYLLGTHHVVQQVGLSAYDHLFVASGIVLMGIGALWIRAAARGRQARSLP